MTDFGTKEVEVIEGLSIREEIFSEDLNDFDDLVEDYKFNCGMSEEEARFAARNCLNEDRK